MIVQVVSELFRYTSECLLNVANVVSLLGELGILFILLFDLFDNLVVNVGWAIIARSDTDTVME